MNMSTGQPDLATDTKAGSPWLWGVKGLGDFADVAWKAAELLGNAPGVRGLAIKSPAEQGSGLPQLVVRAADPQTVHRLADALPVPVQVTEIWSGPCWRATLAGLDLFVYLPADDPSQRAAGS